MAKDQYKYFRVEARELLEGLNQGVLEFERGGRGKDLIGRVLRLAHTLKGASRVVKQPEIAELAHLIEDAFAPLREEHGEISQDRINQVLGMLDAIATKVAALDLVSTETPGQKLRPTPEEFFETVRIEVEEVDGLLEGVSEASVQLSALRGEFEIAERARRLSDLLFERLTLESQTHSNGTGVNSADSKTRALADSLRGHLARLERNLVIGVEQVQTEFAQVHAAAGRLRLVPASTTFPSLDRAVRDAAHSLQKEVSFEAFGGEIRLDAHVLSTLRDALLHIVRNAVAHGIESPAERRDAAKPLPGRVELRVERRGNRAAFTCSDDGRGIDVAAVRRVAVQRGLVASSDAGVLGLEEAVRIIMKGGVTTRGSVDEVSGRGIGLDVVREAAARLKGEVNIRSEAGKGTSLEICVPVSISSLTALEVDAEGAVSSIPLDAVRHTLRVADHDISRSAEGESLIHDGKVIPFLALGKALGRKTIADRRTRSWSVVVLEGSTGMAAIGVDRLVGAANIVSRPFPSLMRADAVVAGASMDAKGNPQLVLNPDGLIERARRAGESDPHALVASRSTVLIIDDSLTTRMLEQNILESAGYQVELATSAEEGLAKAREKQYGLFLVDVEMPGMDGFEFVSRTQSDPLLAKIPSILVTSRNEVEDRRKGERAGARAYIVKGEFDQNYLLRKIREFLR